MGRVEWGSAVCCGVWVSRLATFRASIGWRARACMALACVYVAGCDGRRPGVCLKVAVRDTARGAGLVVYSPTVCAGGVGVSGLGLLRRRR